MYAFTIHWESYPQLQGPAAPSPSALQHCVGSFSRRRRPVFTSATMPQSGNSGSALVGSSSLYFSFQKFHFFCSRHKPNSTPRFWVALQFQHWHCMRRTAILLRCAEGTAAAAVGAMPKASVAFCLGQNVPWLPAALGGGLCCCCCAATATLCLLWWSSREGDLASPLLDGIQLAHS